jgi:TonB family protein
MAAMTHHGMLLGLVVVVAGASSGQIIEGRLMREPLLSPEQVAEMESRVIANPADREMRLRLLRQYMALAPSQPGVRAPFQAARLDHVLYFIENVPADPMSASQLTYVPAQEGPFADAGDHAAVRSAWIRAGDRFPTDAEVLMNAARFLYREDPEDAERLLSRMAEQVPSNRKVAANLGFLYAMDILGLISPSGGPGGRAPEVRERLREHARIELDRSRNVLVLAGAGIALPNLFPRTEMARVPDGDRSVFELAAALMARARELGPQEAELRGPMPLIREFQGFQEEGTAETQAGAPTLRGAAIVVGAEAQAAKLLEKPEAVFPPEALQAKIEGNVRFDVVIGLDGRVESATLLSGHPLLVPAALEAVRRYRYQPTLLNGTPVKVNSQAEVRFTLPR